MKIIEAAKEGKLDYIKYLIFQGHDINEVDIDGRSALHWAAINGDTELLKWLTQEQKLPIDLKDNLGRTPFFESCKKKQWDTAMQCLELNANPNCFAEDVAPILFAAAYLQIDLIDKMLSINDENGNQKLDLNVNKNGNNAMHLAARADTIHPGINLELVEKLYDHGALNSENMLGHTPTSYLETHDYYFGEAFENYVAGHTINKDA